MTTLSIDGMHCAACVRRVRQALGNLPGTRVADVQIGSATLETKAAPEEILAAIGKAGFLARLNP